MSRQASQTKEWQGACHRQQGSSVPVVTEAEARHAHRGQPPLCLATKGTSTQRAAVASFSNHSHQPLAHLLAELAVGCQLDHAVGHGQQVQYLQ